jgi:glyoxalase family protein
VFYTRSLGPRLVKKTVDFDDPTTWHLRSVYFREPGGVLFEIATETIQASPSTSREETPGNAIKLPPWCESRRAEIVAALPPLR